MSYGWTDQMLDKACVGTAWMNTMRNHIRGTVYKVRTLCLCVFVQTLFFGVHVLHCN
jgi:hypothetical protein